MQRASGRVSRRIVGVAMAATLLAACSGTDAGSADPEVRGVTIDREDVEVGEDGGAVDGREADPESGETPAEESGTGASAADDAPAETIGELVLQRSGPLTPGTVWLAAAGEWVGLDAQTLDPDVAPTRAHLDVVLEPAGGRATIEGCTLRFVAPDDATFEAVGVASAEVVIEDAAGEQTRAPLEPVDVEVVLAPGGSLVLDIGPQDATTIEIGAGEAVQVHCEGRFDRA